MLAITLSHAACDVTEALINSYPRPHRDGYQRSAFDLYDNHLGTFGEPRWWVAAGVHIMAFSRGMHRHLDKAVHPLPLILMLTGLDGGPSKVKETQDLHARFDHIVQIPFPLALVDELWIVGVPQITGFAAPMCVSFRG